MTAHTPVTKEELVAAIKSSVDVLAPELAAIMANLGSKIEWSMEDNFETTETIAGLAETVTGVAAGNQNGDDLAFWAPIAREFGLDVPDPDDDGTGYQPFPQT